MRIVGLAALLAITVLRTDAALCIEEDEQRQAEPAPVMMCRLSMFEEDCDAPQMGSGKAMKVKRLTPRYMAVADTVPYADARQENVRAPVKEPHAPGVYSYADSDSWTSSSDDAIGQVVVQSHQDGSEVGSSTPDDGEIPEGNVEEPNEHQYADGDIEYSTCEAGEAGESDKQLLMIVDHVEPGVAGIA